MLNTRTALLQLQQAIDAHLPATAEEAAGFKLSDEGAIGAISGAALALAKLGHMVPGAFWEPHEDPDEGRLADPELRVAALRCLARAFHADVPQELNGCTYYYSAQLAVLSVCCMRPGYALKEPATADLLVEGLDFNVAMPICTLPGFQHVGNGLLAAVESCAQRLWRNGLGSSSLRWWEAGAAAAGQQPPVQDCDVRLNTATMVAQIELWLQAGQEPAASLPGASLRDRFLRSCLRDFAMLCLRETLAAEEGSELTYGTNQAVAITVLLHKLRADSQPDVLHGLLQDCVAIVQAAPHQRLFTSAQASADANANLAHVMRMLALVCSVAAAVEPPLYLVKRALAAWRLHRQLPLIYP